MKSKSKSNAANITLTPCKQVGAMIKAAMAEAGLAADAGAELLGISVGYLACLRCGRPVHLSVDLAGRIRERLNLTGALTGELVDKHNEQAREWYRKYRERRKREAKKAAKAKALAAPAPAAPAPSDAEINASLAAQGEPPLGKIHTRKAKKAKKAT